jgi:nucleotidyltransferase/DNA polymerase involved in DNA repair
VGEIRRKLLDTLHYSSSAGIAHNKLVAKLAASLHKPNGQTSVMWRYSAQLIEQLPISKIRFLGGKLGERIVALGIKNGAELRAVCGTHQDSLGRQCTPHSNERLMRDSALQRVASTGRPESTAGELWFQDSAVAC